MDTNTQNSSQAGQPAGCVVATGSAQAVAAIAALERLAAQHIESARRLYSLEWKYSYANTHMREAQRIAEQIASFAIPPNSQAEPRGQKTKE